MADWYLFAMISLGAFGLQRFLYKVSAERKCNTAWTTFAFMGTVTVLSTILLVGLREDFSHVPYLLFISFINSVSFLAGTIATIESLKHISTSMAYPLIRLNTGIVVIFSVVYFKDRLTVFQIVGIIMAIAVVLILTRHNNESQSPYRERNNAGLGFVLVFVAIAAGAVAAISSKFAALHTHPLAFISVSYAMSTFFAFALRRRLQGENENPVHRDALTIGFMMGIVNFGGFYFLLKALAVGPLSIIASITGLYFVIAIVLAALIYKEKITLPGWLAIVLTIGAITLMRM